VLQSGRPGRATGTLTCETIGDERSFASLAGSWDGLVRSMYRPSPFMLHGWLLEWWRAFGRGGELAVHIARHDREVVAALPLFIRSRWGLRVAAFVGDGESALADLLLATGIGTAVDARLVEHVAASGVDAVDLFGLPRQSRLAAAFGPARLQLIERVEAPVIDLGGWRDWESFYEAKVHASRRRTVRRRAKSLGALGQIVVDVARSPEAVGATLDDAFRLHALRWGSRPDHSTFGSIEGQRFHRAALASLAADDVARVTTMRLDGRAIAFQLWFALGTSAYLYRQAYDPEFARFGLGFAITLEAINAAMAEGHARVELLGGAEPVKLELADRLDPMHEGVGWARGLGGRAFVAARVGALRVTQRLRRSQLVRGFYYEGFGPARQAVRAIRGPQA
jgi:CelD/BcsL family acetyltransferase involved in cellulose biosynthesis